MNAPVSLSAASLLLVLQAAAAGQRAVQCRIVPLARGGDLPREFLVDSGSGKAPKKVKAANQIDADGITVGLSAEGEIRFLDPGAADWQVIGRAAVPDALEDVVVFIAPDDDPDDDLRFRCLVLDAEPKEVSEGGAVFGNAGAAEARVTLGETTEALPSGACLFFGVPETRDEANLAPMKVEVKIDERWRPVKDGSTRFAGEVVYWVILFEQPKVKRPQLRIFKQR